MRYGFAALLMLMTSAVTAAAQGDVRLSESASRVSPDLVIARLMTFDSDRDGRVSTTELSERMQGLVARGDKSGDGALDESEIRQLATAKQFVRIQGLGSGYGFADFDGQSSRNHIENSIDDLRLAADISQEAKRIASAFVNRFEGAAMAHLRQSIAPLVSAEQLPSLERELKSLASFQASISMLGDRMANVPMAATISNLSRQVLTRRQLSDDQIKIAEAAIETFKTEQQLDEARRNLLVAELSEILTSEEGDDLRAALARRPLVKREASFAGFRR